MAGGSGLLIASQCDIRPCNESARWHKKFIRRLQDPLTEAERDEGCACFGTDDFKTGMAAFLAKRKPEVTGR